MVQRGKSMVFGCELHDAVMKDLTLNGVISASMELKSEMNSLMKLVEGNREWIIENLDLSWNLIPKIAGNKYDFDAPIKVPKS